MNLFTQYKNSFLMLLILAITILFALNYYNYQGWQSANETIFQRNATIKANDEKIKGLEAMAQFERADTIDAFEAKSQECAQAIKQAVAGTNVPAREKVVFKTKTQTQFIEKEVRNETICPDHVPNVVVTDAFGLRDIQTAGTDN